jgi:hypothetical protein
MEDGFSSPTNHFRYICTKTSVVPTIYIGETEINLNVQINL